MPIALCLLPVGLVWVWRWWADWQRSKNITFALSDTVYCPVPERSALAKVFQAMGYPLWDWVMRGYVRWQLRPVKNGLWRDSVEDDTLKADGGREPPCPVVAKPVVGTRQSHTRYHLGRSSRIVLL